MRGFAIFRKPYGDTAVSVVGEISCHTSLEAVDCVAGGFVMAPFEITEPEPLVVVAPERVEAHSLESGGMVRVCGFEDFALDDIDTGDDCADSTGGYGAYARDFMIFHEKVLSGECAKLVLARRKSVPRTDSESPLLMFGKACARYPRMFIALVSTPPTGTWLISTPELLVDCADGICHTMSLAGTMPYGGDDNPQWSQKNIEEQRLVTEYIDTRLRDMATDVGISGPATSRAGQLLHLRSEFEFRLRPEVSLAAAVERLYPTPAVSGLPKRRAVEIIRGESAPRSYYSGFAGPVGIAGTTSLYVSLRCMRITASRYLLHAGGGILPDSECMDEWLETEAKMQTMRQLIIN